MLLKVKTKLIFYNEWLNKIKFQDHTDYDLKGNCGAIAVKSESGSVYDFYRSNPVEDPKDFKYTQLYHKVNEVKSLIDYFDFIETTRVRIHKTGPGHKIPLHSDDNNIEAKKQDDYRLRMITALNDDDDFIYRYLFENKLEEIKLKQGQTIIFDPDKVEHGLINKSKNKSRYALVQIFKAYPIDKRLMDFINKDELVVI